MKKDRKSCQITARLTEEKMEKFTKACDKAGLNKSQMFAHLIDLYCDTFSLNGEKQDQNQDNFDYDYDYEYQYDDDEDNYYD